ncbi:MAG: hypothetical protein IK080_11190 [Clostridia bacterium]|nr:hypothetical protein [Clostridia bacterium]
MKKKPMLIVILAAALILVIGAVAVIILHGKTAKTPPQEAETTQPQLQLTKDLAIAELISYSGKFIEDGSDEQVENIAAVRLLNTGETDYQYLEFTVTAGETDYTFVASAVHAGARVTVLSRDRQPYSDAAITGGAVTTQAEYLTPPSLQEDLLEVYVSPGTINLKNKTDRDLPGTFTVYYKNVDENGLLGGITYRASVTGIKAGEIRQQVSAHLGQVMDITYEE